MVGEQKETKTAEAHPLSTTATPMGKLLLPQSLRPLWVPVVPIDRIACRLGHETTEKTTGKEKKNYFPHSP